MGVYIRNIDIPEIKRGAAAYINIDDILFFKTADDILLVPDHGDLIEREYAIASACSGRIRALPTTEDGENWIRVEEVRQSLKSVPVVIPAERSEE